LTHFTSPGPQPLSVRLDGIPSKLSPPPGVLPLVRGRSRRTRLGDRLRIAMLAPPWIAGPPSRYGGVESVVSAVTEALVVLGHDVTLFCAPGSQSAARVRSLLSVAHPNEIEGALAGIGHTARSRHCRRSAHRADPEVLDAFGRDPKVDSAAAARTLAEVWIAVTAAPSPNHRGA
jgi:hypothetical protein